MATLAEVLKRVGGVAYFNGIDVTSPNTRGLFNNYPLHVVAGWADCDAIAVLVQAKSEASTMAIVIKQSGSGYEAVATPPHVTAPAWQSSQSMPAAELIAALVERGYHQTDVGDAFHAANPNWLSELSVQRS